MILLFDYSADWAETEYPDTESLQLEYGKPSVLCPVRAFKKGPVAVQFRVKSEISRIASMKIDHFRTFFRARFLPKMADLRLRKLKSRVVTRDFRQLHLNRPHAVEAPPGIGPGNKGFADLCLTAWLWRR